MKRSIAALTALLMMCSLLILPAAAEEPNPYDTLMTWPALKAESSAAAAASVTALSEVADVRQGESHMAVLLKDGTVRACQTPADIFGFTLDAGECGTEDWEDITAIACGAESTYGVRSDGRVLVAGNSAMLGFDIGTLNDESRAIAALRNIVDIETRPYRPVFALDKNGRVHRFYDEFGDYGETENWRNVKELGLTRHSLFALRTDGTVLCFPGDAPAVRGIRSLLVTDTVVWGRKANGTLVRLDSDGDEPVVPFSDFYEDGVTFSADGIVSAEGELGEELADWPAMAGVLCGEDNFNWECTLRWVLGWDADGSCRIAFALEQYD